MRVFWLVEAKMLTTRASRGRRAKGKAAERSLCGKRRALPWMGSRSLGLATDEGHGTI